MQFKFFAPFLFLASSAVALNIPVQEKRVQCPEAARFGVLQAVPSTLASGDSFTVHADFACAQSFGIFPKYIDYYIEAVSGGNGHQPPVLLARREYHNETFPTDTFSAQLPYDFYLTGANYSVTLKSTYPINGTNGTPVYVVGGTELPIVITTTS